MPENGEDVHRTDARAAAVAVFPRLLRMLRPYRGMIAAGLIALLLSIPCELFPAMVWMYVTDQLIQEKSTSAILHRLISFDGAVAGKFALLGSAVAWLLVIYLIGEVFQTLQQNLLNRVAQRFIFHLRNQVYHKLQSQSLGYLQRQRTGDLMSRAMGDVDEVQNFIVSGIDVIVGEGLLWIATVAIVMTVDWRVGIASLTPLVLVYVLLRIFNRRIKPIYAAVRDRAGDVSTRLQENLSGVVVIKIFNREKHEAERFRSATGGLYEQQIRAVNARSLYFPFARAVGFLSNVAMIGMGGYFILKDGSFTVGKLVLFRAYWWRLFGPVQTLARVNDMVQRAMAAARRVFEVLDAPDELPDAEGAVAVERVRGAMELRGVSFAYPQGSGTGGEGSGSSGQGGESSGVRVQRSGDGAEGKKGTGALSGAGSASSLNPEPRTLNPSSEPRNVTPPTVLHDLSLRIEPGQTVALCGPSGSGKSTVLNLLVRFYDPTAGVVTLDGRDVRSIRRDSLRRHFAVVQQETFLFDDSILDNIRYGLPEATMEQVIAAAKAANAHGFISKLPSGYDTKVGERGVRLSGGQKQRISIARAFLANPTILLLDEPTSSVEPDSEAAIIAALDRLMAGRTTVVTSHRPSLINNADYVYVIEAGRVTEAGTPGQLAGKPGWFARFIRSPEEQEPARATAPSESADPADLPVPSPGAPGGK